MVFCLCTVALLSQTGVVSAQLHPRPAFLPIFDYLGVTHGDTLPRWRRSAPPTLGFKNALQKPTSDVTDTISIFFTVYDCLHLHRPERRTNFRQVACVLLNTFVSYFPWDSSYCSSQSLVIKRWIMVTCKQAVEAWRDTSNHAYSVWWHSLSSRGEKSSDSNTEETRASCLSGSCLNL